MIDNLEVFAWYPILLDLEKSNYIIRELVTKDKSKDKLEDLLISF